MTEMRGYERVERDFNVEYGLFPSVLTDKKFHKGKLKNIGGGGILFFAESGFEPGTQLVVRIFISGWTIEKGRAVMSAGKTDELPLEAIVEVLRSDFDAEIDRYFIGTKFLGRIHE